MTRSSFATIAVINIALVMFHIWQVVNSGLVSSPGDIDFSNLPSNTTSFEEYSLVASELTYSLKDKIFTVSTYDGRTVNLPMLSFTTNDALISNIFSDWIVESGEFLLPPLNCENVIIRVKGNNNDDINNVEDSFSSVRCKYV